MPSEVIINDQSLHSTIENLNEKIDNLSMQFSDLIDQLNTYNNQGGEVFLSCDEACEYLRISRSNLQTLIKEEEIPSIVLRGRRLIPRNELIRVLYEKCMGCCPTTN